MVDLGSQRDAIEHGGALLEDFEYSPLGASEFSAHALTLNTAFGAKVRGTEHLAFPERPGLWCQFQVQDLEDSRPDRRKTAAVFPAVEGAGYGLRCFPRCTR